MRDELGKERYPPEQRRKVQVWLVVGIVALTVLSILVGR